jgi:hypothetical protein
MLKAPRTTPSKVKYDEPVSNFAFNFNLRRYNKASADAAKKQAAAAAAADKASADAARKQAADKVGRCRLTLSNPR